MTRLLLAAAVAAIVPTAPAARRAAITEYRIHHEAVEGAGRERLTRIFAAIAGTLFEYSICFPT